MNWGHRRRSHGRGRVLLGSRKSGSQIDTEEEKECLIMHTGMTHGRERVLLGSRQSGTRLQPEKVKNGLWMQTGISVMQRALPRKRRKVRELGKQKHLRMGVIRGRLQNGMMRIGIGIGPRARNGMPYNHRRYHMGIGAVPERNKIEATMMLVVCMSAISVMHEFHIGGKHCSTMVSMYIYWMYGGDPWKSWKSLIMRAK